MLIFKNVVDEVVQDLLQDHLLFNRIVDWRLITDEKDLTKYIFKNHIVHNMKVLSSTYAGICKTKLVDKVYDILPLNTGTWAIQRGFIDFIPQGYNQEYNQERVFTPSKETDLKLIEKIEPSASYMVAYFLNDSDAVISYTEEETLPYCTKGSVAVFEKDQTFVIDATKASTPISLIVLGIVDLQTPREQFPSMM
jgi:hypothetical protein